MLRTIVSGGQTGVDQAALKAGLGSGLQIGGYCPPGRICEDGLIPEEYPLVETKQDRSPLAPEIRHSRRTENNVIHSDATLILCPENMIMDNGTAWTQTVALRNKKPFLVVDPFDAGAEKTIADWIKHLSLEVLNVAGSSERSSPGIGLRSYKLLSSLFKNSI